MYCSSCRVLDPVYSLYSYFRLRPNLRRRRGRKRANEDERDKNTLLGVSLNLERKSKIVYTSFPLF